MTASDKSKPQTQPVQISSSLHAAIKRLAAQQTADTGQHVTIRGLLEEAILARYPELRVTTAAVTAVTAGVEQDIALMLMTAVYATGDPTEQAARIEELEGSVVGRFGQQIKLRDLAYHLRSIGGTASLADLIRDYEDN